MMRDYGRYAIYWAPPEGDWAGAAARWLGWDPARAAMVAQPELGVPLADWTWEPRKYGFHGTIKAPFRLADGWTETRLLAEFEAICAKLAPVTLPGLVLRRIGSFLALAIDGGAARLTDLAAEVVTLLDSARAPLTAAEVQRRRPDRLTPVQRSLLERWGYPYVLDQFQFHLTLSGSLAPADLDRLQPLAQAHFARHLPRPFAIADLCLFGEAPDGRFHLIHRQALTGGRPI